MTDLIARKISEKAGFPDLVSLLGEQLNGSELSSLLLEVYEQRAARTAAGQLLQQYRNNPLVQPADTDMTGMLEKELEVLRYLQAQQYMPLELSPVALFGSCSAVGTVSQKKIISGIRNTEVMADATNALALHIADQRQHRSSENPEALLRYCTVHRHIRTMQMPVKGYTPHFKIACMVAGGKDTGSFSFERRSLKEQLLHIYHLLKNVFGVPAVLFKLQPRAGYKAGDALITALMDTLLAGLPFDVQLDIHSKANNYYKGVQFKALIQAGDREIDIADGGFTDWTQQLLGNQKERCLISGIGLSLLYKLYAAKEEPT